MENCHNEGQAWEMLYRAWGLNAKHGLVLCHQSLMGIHGLQCENCCYAWASLPDLLNRKQKREGFFLALVCRNDDISRAGLSWGNSSDAMRITHAHFAVGCQCGLSQRRNSNISCRVSPSGAPVSARVRYEYSMVSTSYLDCLGCVCMAQSRYQHWCLRLYVCNVELRCLCTHGQMLCVPTKTKS